MTTFNVQGPIGSGKATIAIAANQLVKWDTTAGNIVVCGVGDIPIGVTQDPIAAGAIGAFYRWGPGHEFLVNGSGIAAGDYVKAGAAGVAVQEGTPTVVTAATIGQAKTASDANNQVQLTATR